MSVLLHSSFGVGSGSGAFVFTLGAVEAVADGEGYFLGVPNVSLPDLVGAEVAEGVVGFLAEQVFACEADYQRAVLEEGLLYGGVEAHV